MCGQQIKIFGINHHQVNGNKNTLRYCSKKKNVKTMAINKTQCRMSSARDVAKRQSLWTLGVIYTHSAIVVKQCEVPQKAKTRASSCLE